MRPARRPYGTSRASCGDSFLRQHFSRELRRRKPLFSARYKALGIGTTIIDGKQKDCLNAYKSGNGVHWALQKEGVITAGTFDSQNLAFWDVERNEYRAYWHG